MRSWRSDGAICPRCSATTGAGNDVTSGYALPPGPLVSAISLLEEGR